MLKEKVETIGVRFEIEDQIFVLRHVQEKTLELIEVNATYDIWMKFLRRCLNWTSNKKYYHNICNAGPGVGLKRNESETSGKILPLAIIDK